jgi:hypothetical protein
MSTTQNFYLADSQIHGKGTWASRTLKPGDQIDVGIDYALGLLPYVTEYFGRYINHSWYPNSHLEYIDNKYYLVATKTIPKNTEITMDYRMTPWYIVPPDPKWK